jgi:hypothetical protein
VPSAPVLSGAFLYSEDGASYFELSWTTPANGGSAITGYTVQSMFGDEPAGLVNSYQTSISSGSSLDFYVFATNAIGNSPLSNVYTAVG